MNEQLDGAAGAVSRARATVALLVGAACVAVALSPGLATAVPPAEGASVATGTLELRAELRTTTYRGDYCAPGSDVTRPSLTCFRRDGRGVVPGLGTVTSTYIHAHESARCLFPLIEVVAADVRFTVEGRGTIDIAMSEIEQCVPEIQELRPSRSFRVVGGTGMYAGAIGSGTVRQLMLFTNDPQPGRDFWEGTLLVPGLEFDVTPPTLSGARGKTVRAPKGARAARVTFTVSAEDTVDGARPVSCAPRSGSRFTLGRTIVSCSAADTSGNVATARFPIVVRPRR
jgi:hypothetical protein